MGKIFKNQDYLRIKLSFTENTTYGIPEDIASAVIQYKNPAGSTGDLTGTVDATGMTVHYDFSTDETLSDYGEAGKWYFRNVATMTDGRILPGEWVQEYIYD